MAATDLTPESQQCSICHESKAVSEFELIKNPNGRTSLRSQCKACRKERYGAANAARVKQRQKDHPEYSAQAQAKARAKRKALGLPPSKSDLWIKEHTEERLAAFARYNARNREQRNAYAKARREANLEEIRERQRILLAARRAADPQKHRDENKAWRLANLDKHREMAIHYRAQRKQSAIIDLSEAQWQEVLAAKGYCCDYCGKKLQNPTKDHITPLVKRGDHTLWNIVVACRSCNSRKNAGAPLGPVQPLLLTIAPKKQKKSS